MSETKYPSAEPVVVDLSVGIAESAHRLVEEITALDGTSPLSEQTLVELSKAARRADSGEVSPAQAPVALVLWFAEPQRPVAVFCAVLAEDSQHGTIEGAVHPEFRGQSIGSRSLRALVDYVREQAPGCYDLWAHQVRSPGSDQTSARSAHLAEEVGLSPVRELRKLRLPLTEQSRESISAQTREHTGPAEITMDTFVPGTDDEAWVELNAAAFADHPEQGKLTLADLHERMGSGWFRAEGFFLARAEDQLAGYHWTKIPAGQHAEGEVYAIGIAPQWQGKKLGRALTLAGMDYLAHATVEGEPLENIVLYVDADNLPAVKLYDSLGFATATVDVMYTGVL